MWNKHSEEINHGIKTSNMQSGKQYKGTVMIGGKPIECEVKNGVPYIDGKTVDEFMKTLTPEQIMQFAVVGKAVVEDKIDGVGKPRSPQKMLNEFHQAKNN